MQSYQLGLEGEAKAAEYIENQGFKIIERNFRAHQGEIDIIANDLDCLVFVEVKYYSHKSYFAPIYAVSKDKRGSIIRAARSYIYKNKLYNRKCRFDVLAIYTKLDGSLIFDHIKNAFIT